MTKLARAAAALLTMAIPAAAQAELPVGARAPDFTAQSAMGGKVQSFNLRAALRRGPVVLYFFPKAFTQGCTLETRAFAEASEQFGAAHATIVGLSTDDIPTLQRFSTEECRSKFAVASATPAIVRSYDVAMKRDGLPAAAQARMPSNLTGRTSYVIAPNGRVSFVHSDLDYREHVRLTLQAVQALNHRH
ncbi:peroxiredoxin [Novosphingobium sp. JCM 18896]|uniref:peroxiredoxin n=1 Tax=Novosphingobium sp. JCM 18896 TaxID=2989731 RepID=UPI002221895D|nr:peroxiredoxin [Novosphingobium sp. JCM 18896]MCW1431203.1 peroxiredoxin [Novosphingobium sp. JCM 18896]